MSKSLLFLGVGVTMVFLGLLVGCSSESSTQPDAPERHHEGDGHDHSPGGHSHIGPHGGHLIELGSDESFHAELLHDEAMHRVTIYILDGEAKKNVAIDQPELVINMVHGGSPRQFKLVAVSQANERRDMASCFQSDDQELSRALDEANARGRIAVNINGRQFVGEIAQHDHDEHGQAQLGRRALR